ncbi:phosphatidylserine decarboxylase precursor [Thiovulum sp. ES]|nr:phosphatidylserine decarboxylase precursor [Thiovulum sp. ES]
MLFTNGISTIFGKFAETKFPKPIQTFINTIYVKGLGLDMSEFFKPSKYETLNQLFTRELQQKRHFATDPKKIIAPSDSQITAFGEINRGKAYQIKGMDYSLEKLFGKHVTEDELGKLEGGEYVNMYLSPKDYHHYHMPIDGKILKATHFVGKLFPVNVPYLRKKVDLFIENERVILQVELENEKKIYIVLVGALNVGKMILNFEPNLNTNVETNYTQTFDYGEGKKIAKGSDLGYFKMGSTVLIFAEKGLLKSDVSLNQKVKFGTTIAELL